MLDVQRERLRHLVANAILELWKKETGSLAPVIIEGTICITGGSGRTTVVQVSNHFSGSIPDSIDGVGPMYHTPKRKMNRPHYVPHHIDVGNNSSVMASYFEELSPASLVSPSLEQYTAAYCKSSNFLNTISNKPRNDIVQETEIVQETDTSVQSMDISNIKEETFSEGEDDEETSGADTTGNSSHAGPVIPGTGFYVEDKSNKCEDKNTNNNASNADDSELNDQESINVTTQGPMMSTPKPGSKYSESLGRDSAKVLDLSSGNRKEGDDLALSSPQNYTAQVRDVIRQRIMASRQHSEDIGKDIGVSKSTVTNGDQSADESQSSSNSEPNFTLPPLLNLNMAHSNMFPLPYSSMLAPSPGLVPQASLHDMLNLSRSRSADMATTSPELFSPRSSPFDQNGNDKDAVVNDKGEPQKVYRCNFCAKTFLFKSKYYEHLPVHTNVRPFQCHLCSRTYKYKYDLRVHLRTHMGIPTKSTVCPFCTVKFDTNKMLRLHIQEFHHNANASEQPEPVAHTVE